MEFLRNFEAEPKKQHSYKKKSVYVLSRVEYLKSPKKINDRQKKVRTVRFANSTSIWFITTA